MGRVSFTYDWIAQQLRLRKLRNSHPRSSVVGALASEGFHIIPNFVAREEALQIREAIEAECVFEEAREGQTLNEWVYDTSELSVTRGWFDNEVVERISREFIGTKALSLRQRVMRKKVLGPTGAFDQFFHNDTWRTRLKFFLYLTDVGAENGPLQYVPRSQRGWWKYSHDFEIYKRTRVGADGFLHDWDSVYVGSLLPHDANTIFRNNGLSPVSLEGEAGTMIIFDARGLHSASQLQEGYRILLENYWIEDGKHT